MRIKIVCVEWQGISTAVLLRFCIKSLCTDKHFFPTMNLKTEDEQQENRIDWLILNVKRQLSREDRYQGETRVIKTQVEVWRTVQDTVQRMAKVQQRWDMVGY